MTYVKQMQRIVEEYRLTGLPWPTSAKSIADWAISSGRWVLPAAAIRRRCADDIASAMREEYMTDRKGRRVRLLHPAPLSVDGQTEMIGMTFALRPAITCKSLSSIAERVLLEIADR
jgi:hypothetical protein